MRSPSPSACAALTVAAAMPFGDAQPEQDGSERDRQRDRGDRRGARVAVAGQRDGDTRIDHASAPAGPFSVGTKKQLPGMSTATVAEPASACDPGVRDVAEVIGGECADLDGQLRATGVAQLVGVEVRGQAVTRGRPRGRAAPRRPSTCRARRRRPRRVASERASTSGSSCSSISASHAALSSGCSGERKCAGRTVGETSIGWPRPASRSPRDGAALRAPRGRSRS